jgi:hypothetical protein
MLSSFGLIELISAMLGTTRLRHSHRGLWYTNETEAMHQLGPLCWTTVSV